MNSLELLVRVLLKMSPLFIAGGLGAALVYVLEARDERRDPARRRDPLECDTCHRFFDTEPSDSFQTYNGGWFCSDDCGHRGGW